MKNPSFTRCAACGAEPDASCRVKRVHTKGWRAPCVIAAEKEEAEFVEFQMRHKIAQEHEARMKSERAAHVAHKARAREQRRAWTVTISVGVLAAAFLFAAWTHGLIGG